jgi:hypothetical protein
MSQPATSPFEGLADLLHGNYSTGLVNTQLVIEQRTENKEQNELLLYVLCSLFFSRRAHRR